MNYSFKEVFSPKLFQTLRTYTTAQFGQDALAGVIEQKMDPHNICANIHFALRRAEDILKGMKD